MAESKKPQDHLPKKEKVKAEKTGAGWNVSFKGASVDIADGAFDDFELLDEIAAVEEGRGARLPALLRRLVGDEGFRDVMDALRDKKTGRVSVEAGAEFVSEVIQAVNPNS